MDKEIKYPAIFYSADNASAKAKKIYYVINFSNLSILFISTILSLFHNLSSIIALIVSLILTTLVFYIKLEKNWYQGRAVAESIKTRAWKLMMRSDPYDKDTSDEEIEELFLKDIKKIIGHKKDFFQLIGGKFLDGDQISESMRSIMSSDFEVRKSIYQKCRITEQKKWYSDKSSKNKKAKNTSFVIILILIVVSIILLVKGVSNITAVLVTLASSTIAWMQLERYQELTQSYALTATELGLIQTKLKHIDSDEDLSKFVDDAESAISREHTMWLARRDAVDLY